MIARPVTSSCDTNIAPDLSKSFNSLNISQHCNDSDVLGLSQELLTHLEETRYRLDTWAKEQMDITDAIRAEADLLSNSERVEINIKMEEIDKVQCRRGLVSINGEGEGEMKEEGEGENIVKEKSNCKEKQKGVEKRLANVHREQYEIQCSINELKQAERVARRKAEHVRKAKERIEASKSVSVEDLTYAVVKYRMTGLDFVKGKNNTLGCKFKQLDPNDHDRTFTFSLKVTDEDEYAVRDCRPILDSEVVLNLLNTLNSSTDGMDVFPEFIRGMRKAFKNSL